MKQCPNCGKTYAAGQAFCVECGTALVEAPPPPPPQPQDEPTILIPPIQPSGAAPAGDPFADTQPQPPVSGPAPASGPVPAPNPPPNPAPAPGPMPVPPNVSGAAKPSGLKAPVVAAAVLAVCTVLAAAAAGFLAYQTVQLRKNYSEEQNLRLDAEKEAAGLQEQLDKLQLDYDKSGKQLQEAQDQLDDARGQLEDVSGQLTSGSSQLSAVEQELDNLINMLDWGYGFGSTEYYASKGVVVVSTYSSESVTIYEDMAGSATFSYTAPGYGFNCQWDNDSFSNGRNSVTITGTEPGYYTLSFTNDWNSDAFDILVIVTES